MVKLAADGTQVLLDEHQATPIERTLSDTPFGGRSGETMKLECWGPKINPPLLLAEHPNGIHEQELFWFKERMNWVSR